MRFLIALCCLLILTTALAADLYAATFTGPAVLQLPAYGQAKPKVFWRAGSGKWAPADFDIKDGRLLFKLDPAKLGAGEVMLLVNPPAGLVLDDFAGPVMTGLKVDGKALKVASVVDLGPVPNPPKQIAAGFKDACNAISPMGTEARLDGGLVTIVAAPGGMMVELPQLEYGQHELVLSATDNSPQRNTSRYTLRFNYVDTGNVALAALGATVEVDSSFGTYDPRPINDGISDLPGDRAGPDITWASAETATPHWVEVTLPRPMPIKEVSIYWAAYTAAAHTPKQFQVQVPEGDGWKDIYTSPEGGEKEGKVTTARFDPVTVSKFRVYMPAGKGSTGRPNLLWIAELKAR